MNRHYAWRVALSCGAALALVLTPRVAIGQEATAAAQATAAVSEQLTVQNIFGTRYFFGESFSATWRKGGRHWVAIDSNGEGQAEMWQVDAASGRSIAVVAALAAASLNLES